MKKLAHAVTLLVALAWTLLACRCAAAAEMAMNGGWAL